MSENGLLQVVAGQYPDPILSWQPEVLLAFDVGNVSVCEGTL